MTLILILILNYVLAKRQPCAIMEDPICTKLMKDTYSMTIEDYNSLKPLQKLIMQDNLNCINENLCPKQLDPITNKENVCINGVSIELNCPCKNIALCSFIPLMDLGAHINASGNDIWGWTQYDENDKYIGYYTLAGTSDGTSIVDITDPYNPNVLAFVQSNVDPLRFIIWRDIKTYKDFAFVVADTTPTNDHYLQIFNIPNIINEAKQYQIENMNKIYIVTNANENVVIFEQFGASHNIHINKDSGFLYAVGTTDCEGGIHTLDINNPFEPSYVSCYSEIGYVHDIQCINYHGPHEKYVNNEICFAYSPGGDGGFPCSDCAVNIIDITDKNNIHLISKVSYPLSAYTHQGWVTGDHKYLITDDEGDEILYPQLNTYRSFIFDIENLENPKLISIYNSDLTVIDHNQFIIDNGKFIDDNDNYKGFVFQSNYESGLRILNIDDIANGNINEVAYFDTYIWIDANSTTHNSIHFRGAWSVYPYFNPYKNGQKFSGIVSLQNINTGLYVLKVNIGLNDIFDDVESFESDSSDSNSEDNYNVVGAMQGLLNGIDKETEENYKHTIKLNIGNDLSDLNKISVISGIVICLSVIIVAFYYCYWYLNQPK
eukprot:58456_1